MSRAFLGVSQGNPSLSAFCRPLLPNCEAHCNRIRFSRVASCRLPATSKNPMEKTNPTNKSGIFSRADPRPKRAPLMTSPIIRQRYRVFSNFNLRIISFTAASLFLIFSRYDSCIHRIVRVWVVVKRPQIKIGKIRCSGNSEKDAQQHARIRVGASKISRFDRQPFRRAICVQTKCAIPPSAKPASLSRSPRCFAWLNGGAQ
jgi:hypothetical protein